MALQLYGGRQQQGYNQQYQQEKERQIVQFLSEVMARGIMGGIGFVEANKCNIDATLKQISPRGNTAMRDSIIQGQRLLLQLNAALAEFNAESNWNFVHIVLTDGVDNSSKATLEDVCALQLTIGLLIPVKRLKTYYIGVDIEQSLQAIKEITAITKTGLENSQFLRINNEREIQGIFEKIKIDLKIIQHTQLAAFQGQFGTLVAGRTQNIPALQIQKQNYCVLFNLDVSGSMAGARWIQVRKAVETFVNQLGQDDFVAIVVFNENASRVNIQERQVIRISEVQIQEIKEDKNKEKIEIKQDKKQEKIKINEATKRENIEFQGKGRDEKCCKCCLIY